MSRRVHKKVDQLAEHARRAIADGFRAGKTAAAVHRDLIELLGEEECAAISERTVSRELRALEADKCRRAAAREQSIAMLEAAKAVPGTASELIQALATQALMEDPESFTGADAVNVQWANLEAEKIRLKRAALEQQSARLALDREKFESMKTKLAAIRKQAGQAKEAVEKAGESISPDLRRKILDVYGLSEADAE
jgi:hypothetical protein